MYWFNKEYLLSILLIITIVILQYHLWFKENGMLDLLRLKKELKVAKALNAELKKNNDALKININSLRKNNAMVEQNAREELGMIKKNEIFYQIVK